MTDADVLRLPDDRIDGNFSGRDGEASRPEAFHYAPVGASKVRERMAMLAAWIAAEQPRCLVVDVSCEVALFARLLSVPVVFVRLAGRRTDAPHLEAFRAADRLIAPFPAALEESDMPGWVREKTTYVGFVGRACGPSEVQGKQRRISLILGKGGPPIPTASIASAARATPAWQWQVFGEVRAAGVVPANLAFKGWCDDLAPHLAASSVVIGGCGDGLLADVAAYGKRFICLPEDRPFDEQWSKARRLAQANMALVHAGWPPPNLWPTLLDRACALDPAALSSLYDPDAAKIAADLIDRHAARRS